MNKVLSNRNMVARLACATTLTATTAIGTINAAVAEEPPRPRFVPGQVIVKFKSVEGQRAEMAPAMMASLGLRSEPTRTSGGEFIFDLSQSAISAAAAEDKTEAKVLEVVEQLNEMDKVEYAQPNWILQHQLRQVRVMAENGNNPDDPLFSQQWHFHNNGTDEGESPGGISLPKRWQKGVGKNEVVVAVVDTGILPDHADIVGSPNLGKGFDFISDSFVGNDGDGRDDDPTDPGDGYSFFECFFLNGDFGPQDDSWHGTHVAGTVGVVNTNNGEGVAGSAWNVTIVPVRVLGKCGGSTTDINDGIRWAAGLEVDGAPENLNPAKIINLSLGGPGACTDSPATQAAINDAVAQGTTVIVAAGNNARDASQDHPASCDNPCRSSERRPRASSGTLFELRRCDRYHGTRR